MNKINSYILAAFLVSICMVAGCGSSKDPKDTISWENIDVNEITIPENDSNTQPESEEAEQVEVPYQELVSTEDGLIWIESTKRENVKVPAYLELPENYDSSKGCPLVVMLPGMGGNHDNNGGFRGVMDNLLQNNIAVLSIDFAGCGLSEEPQTQYSISTMKRDVIDSVAYVKEHYSINKVGVYSYSIGGRVVQELIMEERFIPDTMVFVAPATFTRSVQSALGGEESWNIFVSSVTNDGAVTINGREYGTQFFTDLIALQDGISDVVALKYNGSSEVIYANDDEIVENSLSIYTGMALNSRIVEINWECGHKYIFSGAASEDTIRVCNMNAVEFLNAELKK